MSSPAHGSGRYGLWATRLLCVLVAVLPLIAAAVAPAIDVPFAAAERQRAAVRASDLSGAGGPLLQVEERVDRRLNRIAERTHFAVSVLDEETGQRFSHGSDRFRTASLVKIHLAALMLHRADRGDAELTELERRDVEEMLVRSENEPALRAYHALGGPRGIERGLERAFGTVRIRIGERSYWGRSTTRPRDVVALLDMVLSTDRPESGGYALLQDAMARVVPDQRWGISALADEGSRVQVKVGWVEAPTGWVVNSSGRVVVDGSPLLISVMTDRNSSLSAGISATEAVARTAGRLVRAQRQHAEELRQLPGRTSHLPPCFVSRLPTWLCRPLPWWEGRR